MTKWADMLWQARMDHAPCAPLTELESKITLDDAYRVSELNFRRRVEEQGVRLVGKKIGLTSAAVQQQLGVTEPDFGYLTSDMRLESGDTLAPRRLIQGKFEGEVAFTLKDRLAGPGVDVEAVRAATDYVQVTIEVIDSRVRDWKIKIQDTVADNASSAYFVLGSEKVAFSEVDLVGATMKLWKNDELCSEGSGAACMGDPALAVAWLANCMGRFGVALEPGDIILSGAYGPVVALEPGDQGAVEITGLGRVSFTV